MCNSGYICQLYLKKKHMHGVAVKTVIIICVQFVSCPLSTRIAQIMQRVLAKS